MTARIANCIYAHSGGVSAALNATATGVIEASQHSSLIKDLLIPKMGLHGILNDDFVQASNVPSFLLEKLFYTPSSLFGTSRFKLPDPESDSSIFHTIHDVFKKNQVEYFLYNGGGDSQDTTDKLSRFFKAINYPLQCIGIPKTIDNDLLETDHSPGYGSTAKYIATSTLEAAVDTRAMCSSSTKIFILEVMGRHSGWLAAASALARSHGNNAPHLILMPERPQTATTILQITEKAIQENGFCIIVCAEGFTLRDQIPTNQTLDANQFCSFGHKRLGGIGQHLAQLIGSQLGHKTRWTSADYLQRAVGHIASATDLLIAKEAGKHAIKLLQDGKSQEMVTIKHLSYDPFNWRVDSCPLYQVANHEKHMPDAFISGSGIDVTSKFIQYARPLISGEVPLKRINGIPDYLSLSELEQITIKETA